MASHSLGPRWGRVPHEDGELLARDLLKRRTSARWVLPGGVSGFDGITSVFASEPARHGEKGLPRRVCCGRGLEAVDAELTRRERREHEALRGLALPPSDEGGTGYAEEGVGDLGQHELPQISSQGPESRSSRYAASRPASIDVTARRVRGIRAPIARRHRLPRFQGSPVGHAHYHRAVFRQVGPLAALTLAAISLAAPADAQTVSDRPEAFNLQLFEPASSSRAMLTVDLPAVAPHLAVTASLWANHAPSVLRADSRDLVSASTQAEAHVALGLFQLFEVGFALPLVHQSVTGFSGTCNRAGVTTCPTLGASNSSTSLGDLRFYAKVPILRGAWPLAVRVGVGFPTGDDRAYAGAAYWLALAPSLLASHAFGALTVALNLGARLNQSNASPYLSVNDELTASLGLRYDFSWRFGVIAEALLRVPLDAADAGRFNRRAFVAANTDASSEVFLAASIGVTRAINAYVGGGKGLTDGYGAKRPTGLSRRATHRRASGVSVRSRRLRRLSRRRLLRRPRQRRRRRRRRA